MSKHKKLFAGAAVLLLVFAWFHGEEILGITAAYAQVGNASKGIYSGLFSALAFIIQVLNILLWICFSFLNFLLDPQFIFDIRNSDGEPFEDVLHNIWLLSRDMVNICFALLLIAAAIYTIVRAKKELIQEYWSKFVLVVVLVNFSWFIPRVILDVANVTAATIFNVPTLVGSECATYDELGDKQPCETVVNAMFLVSSEQAQAKKAEGWDVTLKPFVILKKEVVNADQISGFSYILNGLLVNHGRLAELTRVADPVKGDDITKYVMELLRVAIILLIHIALFFPVAAMFMAFLIRIPVLWMTMAFMPFYFLKFVVKNEEIGGVLNKIMSTFVKAAFLPAMTAVPLAVGFILINAGSGFGEADLEGIKIPLIAEVGNLWQILWMVMSMGVLYVGVFAALKMGPEVVNHFTEGINQMGKAAGSFAIKAPLAAPILPGTTATPLSLLKSFDPRALNASLSSGGQIGEVFENAARRARGNDTSTTQGAAKDAATKVKADPALHNDIHDLIQKIQDGINVDQNTTELKKKLALANDKDYSNVETSKLPEIIAEMKRNMDNSKLDKFDPTKFRSKLRP